MANFKTRLIVVLIGLIVNVSVYTYLHRRKQDNHHKPDRTLSQVIRMNDFSIVRNPPELNHDPVKIPKKVVFHPVHLQVISDDQKNAKLPDFSNRPSAKPCQTQAFILLIINSRVGQLHRRDAIRKSWGYGGDYIEMMKSPYAWRLLFILGRSGDAKADKQIEDESRQYGDLILGDFYDNMSNLTHKTLLAMRWALTRCQPIYYFKGDDDVFINQPRFFDYMAHLYIAKSHRFWIGRVDQDWSAYRVVRDPKHKYYVPTSDYKGKLFPHFCSGFAYVMSLSVLRDMVNCIQKVKLLKTVDDAYVGILAKEAKIKPVNNPRFHLFIPPKPNHVFTEKEVDSSLAEHDILKKGQQYRMLLLAKSAMSRDLTPTVKLKAVAVNSAGQQVNITITATT